MKTISLHALLALITGAIATAQAPRGPQGPPQGPQGPPSPLIVTLDADHDKVISAAEIADASTALATLDENGDGQITRDEMRPQRPEGGPPGAGRPEGGPPQGAEMPDDAPARPKAKNRRPAPAIVTALDSDHDGVLSAAEIAAAPASLAKLDKNGDGQLTPDEFAPRPPRRGGPPAAR